MVSISDTYSYGLEMNLRQLEIFDAIMRTGSLSEAARLLGISQPAVSKSLRLAEESAGFVLFRRVRGRLFPSPEAETLLPQVERVRNEVGAVSKLMRQLSTGDVGSVTLAAVPSIAYSFVTPAIARFTRDWPDIQIELKVLQTVVVVDEVARSHADFGLVHAPTDNPYLDVEFICQADCVCVVPRGHRLAGRKTLGPRQIKDEPLICLREDTATGRLVRRSFSDIGVRRDADIVINQTQQALDLVQAGAGVAVVDPFMLIARPHPDLVIISYRPAIPNRLQIIRARERPRSRAAHQLERIIRKSILEHTNASPWCRSSANHHATAGRRGA